MEEVSRVENNEDTDDEDVIEGEDLLSRLQRIMAKKGYLVEMAHPAKVIYFFIISLWCNVLPLLIKKKILQHEKRIFILVYIYITFLVCY